MNNLETEVAVIGVGIAGIMTAFHLLEEGKKEVLLARFRVINGTTGHTTTKLSAQHGLIYSDLIKRFCKVIYGSAQTNLKKVAL